MTRAERGLFVGLAGISAVALALRLYAAARVGFGDSEALYASYALHPAPAYLDHPGLIGLFARALGGGGAPSPVLAHRVTAVISTAAPWIMVLGARLLGASWTGALGVGIGVAATPEIAVGLFGMTPDLLLYPAWILSLGLAGAGLRSAPGSVRATALFVAAGLLAGIGLAAKASAAGLVLALVVTYASRPARAHGRTPWPWLGLALGALVDAPIAAFEARTGFPMLHHRLVATQADAGVSLRNAGALVLGQLAYLSPVLAVLAVLVARDLSRARRKDVVGGLLWAAFVGPAALLVPLCLWSKVAEPHWIAPALLALALHLARSEEPLRHGKLAVGVAGALSLAVYAWVLVPGLAALVPASIYDPRVDISNELYGWSDATAMVLEVASHHRVAMPHPSVDTPGKPSDADGKVVVGPHWVVCAQLEAALARSLPVGCASSEPADFASWNPPERWEKSELVIFVTDNRFPANTSALFPARALIDQRVIEVRRAGRLARRFTIEVLARRGLGSRAPVQGTGAT